MIKIRVDNYKRYNADIQCPIKLDLHSKTTSTQNRSSMSIVSMSSKILVKFTNKLASLQANVDRYGSFHKCGYPKMDGLQWKNHSKMDDFGSSLL